MGIFKFGSIASSAIQTVPWNRTWNTTDFTFTTNTITTLITAYNRSLTSVNVPAVLNGMPTTVQRAISPAQFQPVQSPFSNSPNLQHIEFEPGVRIALNNFQAMFKNSQNLQTAVLPLQESVSNFYDSFSNCYNITNIVFSNNTFKLPTGTKSILLAFADCRKLTSLPILPTDAELGGTNFLDMGGAFLGMHSLVSVPANYAIPSRISRLDGIFRDCYNLTSVLIDFPDATHESMFTNSNKLTTVGNIGSGSGVYYGFSLDSIRHTMNNTFRNCTNLTGTINIKTRSITNMFNMFNGTTLSKTVRVPAIGINATHNTSLTAANTGTRGIVGKNGVTVQNVTF
jgi:hypothetical protein